MSNDKRTIAKLPEGFTAETIKNSQAGRYYVLSADAVATEAELAAEGIQIQKDLAYPGHEGQAGFIVFTDRSLYFWNNGQNEVWADYSDFLTEGGEDDPQIATILNS